MKDFKTNILKSYQIMSENCTDKGVSVIPTSLLSFDVIGKHINEFRPLRVKFLFLRISDLNISVLDKNQMFSCKLDENSCRENKGKGI